MPGSYATPRRRTPRYERLVNGRAVASKQDLRCCAHPDCSTKLSRYNPDDTCNVHGGWTDESVPRRGRKPGVEGDVPGEPEAACVTARTVRPTA